MNQMNPRTTFHYIEKESLTAHIHLNYDNQFYEWISQWMNDWIEPHIQVVAFIWLF